MSYLGFLCRLIYANAHTHSKPLALVIPTGIPTSISREHYEFPTRYTTQDISSVIEPLSLSDVVCSRELGWYK